MIDHNKLGDNVFARSRALFLLVLEGKITLGGCKKAKIYGTLTCKAGKRMKAKNRVFFKDEGEALAAGYRPCGSCMHAQYQQWKQNNGTI